MERAEKLQRKKSEGFVIFTCARVIVLRSYVPFLCSWHLIDQLQTVCRWIKCQLGKLPRVIQYAFFTLHIYRLG